jgi:hypothetical protein
MRHHAAWHPAHHCSSTRCCTLLVHLLLALYVPCHRMQDIWVARDATGARFLNPFPFSSHEPTAHRIISGQPTPVRCCWNGAAVLAAQPFLAGLLRFRSHRPAV